MVIYFHLFASYYFIWKAVKESRGRVGANTASNRQQTQRDIKLAKKVSIIIIGYLIALSPSIVFVILIQINESNPGFLSIEFILNMFLIASWIGLSNSCVNPIVYVGSDTDFRKACKKLLGMNSRIHTENRTSATENAGIQRDRITSEAII